MNWEFETRRLRAFLIIILALAGAFAYDQDTPDCDLDLLKSYQLRGLKKPSHYRMHICGSVQSKCCTLTDEMRIYKLWNGYAKYNNKRFADLMTRSWVRLTEYHEQIKKLSRDDITVHFMGWRWVPTYMRICGHKYVDNKGSGQRGSQDGSERMIDEELPGLGKVERYQHRYLPDYLDFILKQAHMKHSVELYKAALNGAFSFIAKTRYKILKPFNTICKLVIKLTKAHWHNQIAKNYSKMKYSKNKLHIFSPAETGILIKHAVKAPGDAITLFTIKATFETALIEMKKWNKIILTFMEMMDHEQIISSLYNPSQAVAGRGLKKIIYDFVIKYRHYGKPMNKLTWRKFRPSSWRINLTSLPKCGKSVLKMKMRIYRRHKMKQNLRKRKKDMNRRKITAYKRMKILAKWKKNQMAEMKKVDDKTGKRNQKVIDMQKKRLADFRKRKEKEEERKDLEAQAKMMQSMGGGTRKLRKKETRGKRHKRRVGALKRELRELKKEDRQLGIQEEKDQEGRRQRRRRLQGYGNRNRKERRLSLAKETPHSEPAQNTVSQQNRDNTHFQANNPRILEDIKQLRRHKTSTQSNLATTDSSSNEASLDAQTPKLQSDFPHPFERNLSLKINKTKSKSWHTSRKNSKHPPRNLRRRRFRLRRKKKQPPPPPPSEFPELDQMRSEVDGIRTEHQQLRHRRDSRFHKGMRRMKKPCDAACRKRRLPKNIDFNFMCILPPSFIKRKRYGLHNTKGRYRRSQNYKRRKRREKRLKKAAGKPPHKYRWRPFGRKMKGVNSKHTKQGKRKNRKRKGIKKQAAKHIGKDLGSDSSIDRIQQVQQQVEELISNNHLANKQLLKKRLHKKKRKPKKKVMMGRTRKQAHIDRKQDKKLKKKRKQKKKMNKLQLVRIRDLKDKRAERSMHQQQTLKSHRKRRRQRAKHRKFQTHAVHNLPGPLSATETVSERMLMLVPKTKQKKQKIAKKYRKMLKSMFRAPIAPKNNLNSDTRKAMIQESEAHLSVKSKLAEQISKLKSGRLVQKLQEETHAVSLKDGQSLDSDPNNHTPQRELLLQRARNLKITTNNRQNQSLSQDDPAVTKPQRQLWFGGKKKNNHNHNNDNDDNDNDNNNQHNKPKKKKGFFGNLFEAFSPSAAKKKIFKNKWGRWHVKKPKMLKLGKKIMWYKNEMNRLHLINTPLKLTSLTKGFFYRIPKDIDQLYGSFVPRTEHITCRTFKRHIWKSFINVNKEKTRYCYRIWDNLQDFDLRMFRYSIMGARFKLMDMLKTKRGFYCALCDYEKQKMFNHETKVIAFDKRFCFDFLDRFQSFISFNNIVMIEYMDQMLQLISCFRANGRRLDFPFRNVLEFAKRKIFFIQRCFTHPTRDETFFKYCLFMCKQYEYVKFSKFFDGNLRVLNIVLMRIYQYLRELQLTPYLKSPPYQVVKDDKYNISYEFENTRYYDNDSSKFIMTALKKGKLNPRVKRTMKKKNPTEKMENKINYIQWKMFYDEDHKDGAVKTGRKKLWKKQMNLKRLRSQLPLGGIKQRIKQALEQRKQRKHQRSRRGNFFKKLRKKTGSTDAFRLKEGKMITQVKEKYAEYQEKWGRQKKEMKENADMIQEEMSRKLVLKKRRKQRRKLKLAKQKQEERKEKRELRLIRRKKVEGKAGKGIDQKLRDVVDHTNDDEVADALKSLADDSDYYGTKKKNEETNLAGMQIGADMNQIGLKLESQERANRERGLGLETKQINNDATAPLAPKEQTPKQDDSANSIFPHKNRARILSHRKSKKSRKKYPKNIVVYKQRYIDQKTNKKKYKRVPMRVISFIKKPKWWVKKKKKKFNRFQYIENRHSLNFGYYPEDSEHIRGGIYEARQIGYDLKTYTTLILTHLNGLRPLLESDNYDDQLDMTTILQKDYMMKNPNQFSEKAIIEYFKVPNKTIDEFNKDMNMNIVDKFTIEERARNPKIFRKSEADKKRKKKKMSTRVPRNILKPSEMHNEMMRKHNVYLKHHQNPEGVMDEYDPKTSADTTAQMMFYVFDHRSKYPMFQYN